MSAFGQPAQPAAATNSFGQQNQAAASLFGPPQQPAANIFGQQQPQQQQSGSLLSRLAPPANIGTNLPANAWSTNTTAQPATGLNAFSNFGQNRASAPAFGQSTTNSLQQQPQQQQQPPTFSLVPPAGQSQAPNAFSSFLNPGAANQQQPQQQQPAFGSAFGQQTQQNQQNQQQQQQQPQKPAFSWPSTNTWGSSNNTWGQTSTSTAGQSLLQQPQQQQQFGLAQSQVQPPTALQVSRGTGLVGRLHQPEKTLEQRATEIAEAWDPRTGKCKFRHIFYNVRKPEEMGVEPAQPANVTDEEWQNALRMNPDPQNLYPVVVAGYNDLRQRLFEQAQMANAQTVRLKQLLDKIDGYKKKYSLESSVRIQQSQLIETYLHHRILAISARLHLLMPDLRAKAITPEEEQLAAALQALDAEMSGGSGSGRMRGKVNELWTALGTYKATKERERREGGSEGLEWVVADEQGFDNIKRVLGDQYRALEYITKLLTVDEFDVDHLRAEGYGIHSPTQS